MSSFYIIKLIAVLEKMISLRILTPQTEVETVSSTNHNELKPDEWENHHRKSSSLHVHIFISHPFFFHISLTKSNKNQRKQIGTTPTIRFFNQLLKPPNTSTPTKNYDLHVKKHTVKNGL